MEITMQGNPLTLLGNDLHLGELAPNFTALKKDVSEFNLYDLKNKPIVITSFPSIDTKICSFQVSKFNKEIEKLDAFLITISNDLPYALDRYCAIEGLKNVFVLSDYLNLDFANKYGVNIKELRLLARSVFIIDKNKKIIYKEIAKEIKTHLNYEKAIEELENIL